MKKLLFTLPIVILLAVGCETKRITELTQSPTSTPASNPTITPAYESNDNQQLEKFRPFITKFKQLVNVNDVTKIANVINFPFYIYSFSYSQNEFLNDKSGAINFFTKDVRKQILQSSLNDIIVYENKNEIGHNEPDLASVPNNSTVFELDIINNYGGPAMRLIFAKSGADYKLFSLTQ